MGDTEKVMMTFQVPLEMRTRFKRACGTLGTGMSQAIRDFMDTVIANDKPAELPQEPATDIAQPDPPGSPAETSDEF